MKTNMRKIKSDTQTAGAGGLSGEQDGKIKMKYWLIEILYQASTKTLM